MPKLGLQGIIKLQDFPEKYPPKSASVSRQTSLNLVYARICDVWRIQVIAAIKDLKASIARTIWRRQAHTVLYSWRRHHWQESFPTPIMTGIAFVAFASSLCFVQISGSALNSYKVYLCTHDFLVLQVHCSCNFGISEFLWNLFTTFSFPVIGCRTNFVFMFDLQINEEFGSPAEKQGIHELN